MSHISDPLKKYKNELGVGGNKAHWRMERKPLSYVRGIADYYSTP